jgi:hypothetical protein
MEILKDKALARLSQIERESGITGVHPYRDAKRNELKSFIDGEIKAKKAINENLNTEFWDTYGFRLIIFLLGVGAAATVGI